MTGENMHLATGTCQVILASNKCITILKKNSQIVSFHIVYTERWLATFAKLGHEKCWACEKFMQHETTSGYRKGEISLKCNEFKCWNQHRSQRVSTRFRRAEW